MSVYQRENSPYYFMVFTHKGKRVNKSTGSAVESKALAVEAEERARIDAELAKQAKLAERVERAKRVKQAKLAKRAETPPVTPAPTKEEGESDGALLLRLLLKALDGESALRQALSASQLTTPKDLTLSKAIDRIYEERWKSLRDGEPSKQTLIRCMEVLGDIGLRSIDEEKINKLRVYLREKKLSESTVNRYLAHLKTLLNAACKEWKILDKVPFIRLSREKKGRLRVVSEQEEAEILRILRGPESEKKPYYRDIADLVEVLVDTGMRLGEARCMTYRENIETKQMIIHLHPDQTKSSQPRSIPMTERVRQILERRQATNDKAFPLDQSLVDKTFKRVKKAMGIDDKEFVIHALRHTCASRMINRGVDLYTVQKMLGHSSITVTERYAHLDQSKLRAAVKTLEPEGDGSVP